MSRNEKWGGGVSYKIDDRVHKYRTQDLGQAPDIINERGVKRIGSSSMSVIPDNEIHQLVLLEAKLLGNQLNF